MTFSIALATYNGEKYLAEQLDSIFSQTFQDFELCISDDGSKDGTEKIIENYIEKYNTKEKEIIKFSKNTKYKKGVIGNFSNAIDMCGGGYVVFCDQDDVWLENKLEIIYKNIKENPDKKLFYHDAYVTYKDIFNKNILYYRDVLKVINKENDNIIFLGDGMAGCTSTLESNFLKSILPIYENMSAYSMSEDNYFFIDSPLIYYRRHENAVSDSAKKLSEVYSKYSLSDFIGFRKEKHNKYLDSLVYVYKRYDLTLTKKNKEFLSDLIKQKRNVLNKVFSFQSVFLTIKNREIYKLRFSKNKNYKLLLSCIHNSLGLKVGSILNYFYHKYIQK
jgi:glycosyltransferase involved in cell wall biosynthesis